MFLVSFTSKYSLFVSLSKLRRRSEESFGEFGKSQRGVLLSEDISIPTQKIPTTPNVGVRSGH